MKILSIETSCDETSVSVLECLGACPPKHLRGRGLKKPRFKILSNVVLSQIDIHKEFGGVVPNLARREHQKNLVPILMRALTEAKLLKSNLKSQISKLHFKNQNLNKILKREPELLEKTLDFLEKYEAPKIDLIAVTRGPGLEPALWVGVNFARALSRAWGVPVLGVNHLEGHIYSIFLKKNRVISKSKPACPVGRFLISNKIQKPKFQNIKIKFPALALVVSGGHTELILIKDWLKYKIIGQTLDDAAGEAFDKAARILGLGYPGGPEISKQAELHKPYTPNPIPYALSLPRPMLNSKDFNFSFSGLKTAVLYLVQNLKKSGKWSENLIPQIACEFQEAVVEVLIKKSLKAAEKYNIKTFILCGGVSANNELRHRISDILCKKYGKSLNFLMPEIEFSGDNAAMIGAAAYPNYLNQKSKGKPLKIAPFLKANGNLNF